MSLKLDDTRGDISLRAICHESGKSRLQILNELFDCTRRCERIPENRRCWIQHERATITRVIKDHAIAHPSLGYFRRTSEERGHGANIGSASGALPGEYQKVNAFPA